MKLVQMKYTAPQLNEMDASQRGLARQAVNDPEAGIKHMISLMRSGEIDHVMLQTAAMFGNNVAKMTLKVLDEPSPTINSPADLLHMFGLHKDETASMFQILRKAAPAGMNGPKETAAWAIGWILNQNDWRQAESVAHRAIGEIADELGLDWILQTLKPHLVHPSLQ